MKTLSFTDKWLKSLKPGADREEYADLLSPGLRLRVGARSMTWSVLTRQNGKRHRVTLGANPELGLKSARAKAVTAADGIAPQNTETDIQYGTLADLLRLKINRMKIEDRESAVQYSGYFFNGPESVVAVMDGSRPARDITPADCTAWLRKIHQRGTDTKHPRAYLSSAFSFGLKYDNDPKADRPDIRFGLIQNPVQHVGGGGASGARKRNLDMEELAFFWHGFAGRRVHPQSRILMRLIIAMGGVRITEIVRSEKTWWNAEKRNELWLSLPKTKNEKEHDLPVTKAGTALLKAALLIGDDGSKYLFPSPENPASPRSLSGVSQVVRRWCTKHDDFENFQPRDLRRTIKTLLIENHNINRDWIDIWHNHGRGADVGRKHYDWAEYTAAKKAIASAIDQIVADLDKMRPELS